MHDAAAHDPTPCESINADYAVLADRKGGSHFLLIPTRSIDGIENPTAYAADAPNYFEGAWQARGLLARAARWSVPREAVAMATNPKRARTQDQLHIHIECLRPVVARSLRAAAATFSTHWTPIRVLGFEFQVRRVMGEDLLGANPIRMLANDLPGARQAMEAYSLIVVGMNYPEGPGFALLADTSLPGELLLDSSCALAQGH